MNYLTEQFIGEQVDCEEFGLGTVVEIKENTVVVALEYGLAEIDIEDLEITEEAEQIDELSKKTLASYVPKAANRMAQSHASVVKARHDYDSAAAIDHATSSTPSNVRDMAKSIIRKDASKREIDNLKDVQKRHQGIERAAKKLAKEEVEAIEELSNKTMRSYTVKASSPKNNPPKESGGYKRDEHIAKATSKLMKKEEVELEEAHSGYKADSEKSKFNSGHRAKLLNPEGRVSYLSGKSYKTPAHAKAAAKFYGSIMHLPIQTMDSKMSNYNKAYDAKHGDVKESVELDEARGRPPKAPKEGQKASPAWLRHLERQNKGEDKEEIEALGAQLRKSVSINKPVTFINGEKKEVANHHIAKFEDHMAARPRTIDKQEFQNKAHASHDAFVKAVSEPIPKPQGGTSSIVKYR